MQLKTETKVGLFILIAIGLFTYMTLYLGVFRLYVKNYNFYHLYFQDLSGLEKKSDVKIAGVKVGWIDNIQLINNGTQAKVLAAVKSEYQIFEDAHAEIKQETLLSGKYLEIFPGNPKCAIVASGASFARKVESMVSMEHLIKKFDNIATNIEDLSYSLKNTLGSSGQQDLKNIINNINEAAGKIAVFTDVLSRNEKNIDLLINNLNIFSKNIMPIGNEVNKIANQLYTDVLPSFQSSIQRISDIFDRDFNRVAGRLDSTMENISAIAQKVNNGEGLFGKLVNETDIYDDIKVISQGFKDYSTFADNLGVVIDGHGEYMCRPAEHYRHEDNKGYLDIRFYTSEDLFYLFQIVGTEKGTITRDVYYNRYFNNCDKLLTLQDLKELPSNIYFEPPKIERDKIHRNTQKFGLQVGKIYKDLALRLGIFEGFAGAAIDYQLPTLSENFRWLTSIEAWDFTGQDKINDRRPHLKWINKVYFLRNLYADFGADDFISRKNANAFFGFGLRFSDEDLKYLVCKAGALLGGGLIASDLQ